MHLPSSYGTVPELFDQIGNSANCRHKHDFIYQLGPIFLQFANHRALRAIYLEAATAMANWLHPCFPTFPETASQLPESVSPSKQCVRESTRSTGLLRALSPHLSTLQCAVGSASCEPKRRRSSLWLDHSSVGTKCLARDPPSPQPSSSQTWGNQAATPATSDSQQTREKKKKKQELKIRDGADTKP